MEVKLSNLPIKSDPKKDPIYRMLTANTIAIKSVLPKHLTPERMLRLAYMAVNHAPELRRCSQESLLNAMIEASILGLEVFGPLGEAFIIPYKGKAVFIPGYRGYIQLAYRSGQTKTLYFHPTYEKDQVEVAYGLTKNLIHVPSQDDDPGKLVGAYSCVHYKGGGFDFEHVNRRIAMDAKASSPAGNSKYSPWNVPNREWTMWAKTAVRRMAKRMPLSPELQRATNHEEMADAKLPQNISHVSGLIPYEINPEPDLSGEIKDAAKTAKKVEKETKALKQQSEPSNKSKNSPTKEQLDHLSILCEESPSAYKAGKLNAQIKTMPKTKKEADNFIREIEAYMNLQKEGAA